MNNGNECYKIYLNDVRIKLGKAIRKRVDFNYDKMKEGINNLVFDLERFTRNVLSSDSLSKDEKKEIESEVFELLDLIAQCREAVEFMHQLVLLTTDKADVSEGAI